MVKEGLQWPRIETGGMLFGNLIEDENHLVIEILKTQIPSDENCIRESAYFEINPDYAKQILSQEELDYLGNWHKHPGYGGPSHGDHQQIHDFFLNNPHLDVILTFILNFHSEREYEPIIEVYFREKQNMVETSFITRSVPPSNLSFTPTTIHERTPVIREKGVSTDILSRVKHELVNIFDHLSAIHDIQDYPGQAPDEKVLSFPYQCQISHLDQLIYVNLMISISFPPEFPKGKLYFDISSEDMSKNFTFKTHTAETLNDMELVHPFLSLLKSDIEDDLPVLLEKPLWRVIQNNL